MHINDDDERENPQGREKESESESGICICTRVSFVNADACVSKERAASLWPILCEYVGEEGKRSIFLQGRSQQASERAEMSACMK